MGKIAIQQMSVANYILATAGHVDHGKSALVRVLTGIDPDRLPEEKARGITIDLGFAHLDLAAPKSAAPVETYRLGVVDVPGHEDFVKNMVAGVGSIDLALLVVAADDGWMPQTEEHLQILCYMGVSHGVVALTKIDLAESEESLREQIRRKLEGTPLAEAPIVATSVVTGRGMDDLKAALSQELARTPPQPDIGKPRLAVDRVFTLHGIGTVATGTLTGGTLNRGQAVAVQPGGTPAKIRTLQSYNHEVEQAVPGSRVALNVPDLHAGETSRAVASISRGSIVTLPGLGHDTDTLDVLVEVSARSEPARRLKEGTRVRLHHGSGNTPASVYFHGANSISPGQRIPAQLRLEAPIFAFIGDRFILRDWPEQHTLAGGIVLDPHAPRRGFRSEERRQFLQSRAAAGADVAVFVASEIMRAGTAVKTSLLVESRFSAARIADALERLIADGSVAALGEKVAGAPWWGSIRTRAIEAIDAEHRKRPEEAGMRLVDLRHALFKDSPQSDVFDELVADLCRRGCVKSGVSIRRVDHRPVLPPRLQPAGARLRAALAAKPLEPPSRKELTPDALAQQALRFLLQTGEAVEIGDDVVLHAAHYQRAVETVRTFLRTRGSATVSELKQALNTSRRIMVPLAEKLDRDGITLRKGDMRVLRQS